MIQPLINGRFGSTPVEDRFWEKIGSIDDCWIWEGSRSKDGYGNFYADGKLYKAYSWSYQHFVGEVPKGLELDHLCRVTSCVNPDHLEAVTHQENMKRWMVLKRITHCKQGHELTPDNTLYGNGRNGTIQRRCTECKKEWSRKSYLKHKLQSNFPRKGKT